MMIKRLLIVGAASNAKDDIDDFKRYGVSYDTMLIGVDSYGLGKWTQNTLHRITQTIWLSYRQDHL